MTARVLLLAAAAVAALAAATALPKLASAASGGAMPSKEDSASQDTARLQFIDVACKLLLSDKCEGEFMAERALITGEIPPPRTPHAARAATEAAARASSGGGGVGDLEDLDDFYDDDYDDDGAPAHPTAGEAGDAHATGAPQATVSSECQTEAMMKFVEYGITQRELKHTLTARCRVEAEELVKSFRGEREAPQGSQDCDDSILGLVQGAMKLLAAGPKLTASEAMAAEGGPTGRDGWDAVDELKLLLKRKGMLGAYDELRRAGITTPGQLATAQRSGRLSDVTVDESMMARLRLLAESGAIEDAASAETESAEL